MKVFQQKAYVLHCTPYSETSLLVNIFSREYGRLTLIAKGAKRKKSMVRGLLLPFRPLLMSWSGKGQLPTLTHVEQAIYVPELKGVALFSGYYVNELLLKLLHRNDPHELLFDYYEKVNEDLGQSNMPHQALRWFEALLLREIGFGLVVDRDVETAEVIDAGKRYCYFPERGPVVIPDNVKDPHYGEPYGLVISGRSLIAIAQQQFDSGEVLLESQRLFRRLIDIQLNGRALRTRKVMRQLTRYVPTPG